MTERYWGSLRLLLTTGPNMLRDVFPQLLEEGEVVESATIWESSRICASAVEGQPGRARNGVNYVLNEAGIGEVALMAGLTQIVSVFDARIYRVLKAVGCQPDIIGRPQRIGETMAYAGLFEPNPHRLEAFRTELGMGNSLGDSVFSQPTRKSLSREREPVGRRRSAPTGRLGPGTLRPRLPVVMRQSWPGVDDERRYDCIFATNASEISKLAVTF